MTVELPESNPAPDAGADYSQFGVTPEPQTPVEPAPNAGGNPAWAPILEALPDDGLRAIVRPHLEEWDKGVQKRFTTLQEQLKPWERFQGQDPTALERGFTLKQRLDTDPVAFYQQLQNYLRQTGMLQEEPEVDPEEDPQELPPDPRIEQLTQQQQQIAQMIRDQQMQQYQAQMEAQAMSEVQAELAAIETKVGKLSEPLKKELLQRAAFMTDQAIKANQPPPSLQDAWDDLQNLISSARQAPRPAPRIVPSGGGLPAPQPATLDTAEGRKARAVEVLEAMRNQQ